MAYTFGQRLRYWREFNGMTRTDLAKQAKIRASKIRDYEFGRVQPDVQAVRQICAALEMSAREFFLAEITIEELRPPSRRASAGELLRYWRECANLERRDLAKLTKISARDIAQYELGRKAIVEESMEKILSALNLTREKFYRQEGKSDAEEERRGIECTDEGGAK